MKITNHQPFKRKWMGPIDMSWKLKCVQVHVDHHPERDLLSFIRVH